MKSLVEFINEELNKHKVEAVLGQYDGKTITIIGKPFTTDRDERYALAMEFAKKNGIKFDKSLEDVYKELGDKAEDVEYWVAIADDEHKGQFVDFEKVTPDDDTEYKAYIKESKDAEVYAVVDFTGAIQGVFDDEEDAKKAAADLPKEAEAKVQKMKKSEIEK